MWAYVVASVMWGVILWRRRKARAAGRIVNVTEGYHRETGRGGF